MAPAGDAYFVDWIWSNNSNVHVAQHRDWFTTFTKFKTSHSTLLNHDFVTKVLGIGDVRLEVKNSRSRNKRNATSTILLKNVLYAPKAVCNILGGPILDDFEVDLGGTGSCLRDRQSGAIVGLIDHVGLSKLWLKNHGKGRSSLDPNTVYYINARWPDAERRRWEDFRAGKTQPVVQIGSGKSVGRNPNLHFEDNEKLTDIENAWLKRHYGSEFKFLQTLCLKIYSEEDRAEGRTILRSFMREDDFNSSDEHSPHMDSGDGDGDEIDDWLEEMEEDPMSHLADYHFTAEQLEWIKDFGYKHSGNFMLLYGLKPYNDEDCLHASVICQDLMDKDRYRLKRR